MANKKVPQFKNLKELRRWKEKNKGNFDKAELLVERRRLQKIVYSTPLEIE